MAKAKKAKVVRLDAGCYVEVVGGDWPELIWTQGASQISHSVYRPKDEAGRAEELAKIDKLAASVAEFRAAVEALPCREPDEFD